jgi:hypothetical protein
MSEKTYKVDIPQITTEDMKGEALVFKLNLVLQLIASQVAKAQGNNGPFSFGEGPLTFPDGTSVAGGLAVSKAIRVTGESDRNGNVNTVEFINGMPEYADDAAAKAGGLTRGRLYRTSAGAVMVVM